MLGAAAAVYTADCQKAEGTRLQVQSSCISGCPLATPPDFLFVPSFTQNGLSTLPLMPIAAWIPGFQQDASYLSSTISLLSAIPPQASLIPIPFTEIHAH